MNLAFRRSRKNSRKAKSLCYQLPSLFFLMR